VAMDTDSQDKKRKEINCSLEAEEIRNRVEEIFGDEQRCKREDPREEPALYPAEERGGVKQCDGQEDQEQRVQVPVQIVGEEQIVRKILDLGLCIRSGDDHSEQK